MSNGARKDAATAPLMRLSKAMFGEGGLQREAKTPQPRRAHRSRSRTAGDKTSWQVPVAVYADASGQLGGSGRKLVESEHREAVENALADGKAVPADVLADYSDLKPKFSRAASPIYYSDLARGIERASMNAAPGKAWLDYLKGLQNKGVKSDEIQWSGITDWLAMQEGKITKQAVVGYLRENGVKVEETVLGEGNETSKADELRVRLDALGYEIDLTSNVDGRIQRLRNRDGALYMGHRSQPSGENERMFERLPMEVQDLVKEYNAAARRESRGLGEGQTRYSNYTLPGGENYRELLLTLPETKTPKSFEQWTKENYTGEDNEHHARNVRAAD
jgi:hypothetical protein